MLDNGYAVIRRTLGRARSTRAIVGTAVPSGAPPDGPPSPPTGICILTADGIFRVTAVHAAGARITVRLVGAGGGSGNENGGGGGGVAIFSVVAAVGVYAVTVGQPNINATGGQTILQYGAETHTVNGGAGAGPQYGGNSGGPSGHRGGSGHGSGINSAGGGGGGAGSDGVDAAEDGTGGGAGGIGMEGYGPGGRGAPPGGIPSGPGGGGGGGHQGAKGLAYFTWVASEIDAECG